MDKENKQDTIYYLPLGMCIGLSLGVAIGSAVGNISVCMCLGLAFGVGIGAILDEKKKKDSQEEQK